MHPKLILEFIKKYIVSLLAILYLYTLGFFFQKNRNLFNLVLKHFNLLRTKSNIPAITIDQVTNQFDKIILPRIERVRGNVSFLEHVVIAKLIKKYKPKAIFEIGTFDGRTTLSLAANSSEKARIFTLDLPKHEIKDTKLKIDPGDKKYIKKEESGVQYKNTKYEKKIKALFGDSASFNFTPYQNKIDFIFIDGSHTYDYVLNDSKRVLPLLRKGKGVLLWHDFNKLNEVTKAINELQKIPFFKNIKHIENTSLCFLEIP